jgi:hypothetical protein
MLFQTTWMRPLCLSQLRRLRPFRIIALTCNMMALPPLRSLGYQAEHLLCNQVPFLCECQPSFGVSGSCGNSGAPYNLSPFRTADDSLTIG